MNNAEFRICPSVAGTEQWTYSAPAADLIPFVERYFDNADSERGIFRPLVQASAVNPPPLFQGGDVWNQEGVNNYLLKMGPNMQAAYQQRDQAFAEQHRNRIANFRELQYAGITLTRIEFLPSGDIDLTWRCNRPGGGLLFANDHPCAGISARLLERSLCFVTEVLLRGGLQKKTDANGDYSAIDNEDMMRNWYVSIRGRTGDFAAWEEGMNVDDLPLGLTNSFTNRQVTNVFKLNVGKVTDGGVFTMTDLRNAYAPLPGFFAHANNIRTQRVNWFGIDRLMWAVGEHYRPRGAVQQRDDFAFTAANVADREGLADEYEWLFELSRPGVYLSEMTIRLKSLLWLGLAPGVKETYYSRPPTVEDSTIAQFVNRYYPAVTASTFLLKDIYRTIAEYVTVNNVRLPLRRVLYFPHPTPTDRLLERHLSMIGSDPVAQAAGIGPMRGGRGSRELAGLSTSSSFIAGGIIPTGARRRTRLSGLGGCWRKSGRNSRGGQSEILSCGWMVWNPCVKMNNCLIACFFKAFAKDVERLAKGWKIQDVKKEYLRRTPSEMCDFDDVEKLEHLFHCKAVVYNELRQVIYGSSKDLKVGERCIELLLMEKHYQLVKMHEPWTHECDDCGRMVKDIVKHKCNEVNKEQHFQRSCEQVDYIRKAPMSSDVVKQGQTLQLLNRAVFFDFETVHIDNKFQVYAVGMYVTWLGEYKAFYGQNCVREFMRELEVMVETTEGIVPKKESLYLVSFNGSGFDHFMIMEECLRQGRPIGSFLMARGRLLQLAFDRWKTVDMYLFVGPSSLSKVCDAFKVPVKKDIFPHLFAKTWEDVEYVGPYLSEDMYPDSMKKDYREVRASLPENAIFSFRDECLKYLEKDVMCLFHLTNAFASSMMDVTGLNVMEYITLSQLSFEFWRQKLPDPTYEPRHLHFKLQSSKFHVPKDKRPPPLNAIYLPRDVAQYEFIQKAIYGGRTHPVKMFFLSEDHEKPFEDIKDFLIDGDVRSLYPTAMVNPFPVGRPFWVNKYKVQEHEYTTEDFQRQLDETGQLPLSIWEVKVYPNKSLVVPALPKKVPLYPNRPTDKLMTVWDLTDSTSQIYTSVDLEQGVWYGYRFELQHGLVWPMHDKVFGDYIQTVFEIKNQEDIKDKNKDPSYNPARRNIAKLQMNALYGKMLQKVVKKDFKLDKALDFDQYETFISKHDDVRVHDLVNDWTLFEGTKRDVVPLMKKPNHLGAFVLAFSRRVMNMYFDAVDPYRRECKPGMDGADTVEKSMKESFYYTDTDSMFFHSSQYERNMKEFFVDGLGKLDDELRGSKIVEAYFLAPKLYALRYKSANGKEGVKMRAKGIPASLLKFEHFKQMYHAQEPISYTFDMFKKHLFRLNETERKAGYHEFSVSLHQGQHRRINQQPSKARVILEGRKWTVPHGFDEDILDVWRLAGVEDMYQTTSENPEDYHEVF